VAKLPVLAGTTLTAGDQVFTVPSHREGRDALKWLMEYHDTDAQFFSCGWVLEDYGPEGEPYTFECGAVAVGHNRGWDCFYGHSHVNAEVRHNEGWDYFDDDEIAALRSGAGLAYTGVADMQGRRIYS
jgi:hypothetical protein